ncbi:pumilio homolog 24-like isoform X1 [Coffea arabica]|uniref:Pumilio homolog 24-like isoform X1 n=1 Tax=Coffea arabica TaxID=13443 RepID=A0A6P6WKG4_COFAR|nr:pumilio homolog 24-like isoform X1 [Coffea arabica]
MAAKPLKSNDSKKRKRIAGPKGEERKSNPKRLKSPSTNNSQSGSKKPFKASKRPPSKQHGAKPPTQKHVPDTKKQRRLLAKELAEARKKKRKKHYTLEQELSILWEKMRRRDIAKEDRSKLASEALGKMKGKIPEIASSHVSSRVLQTCVKHCSQEEKSAVFMELQPHFISLATNTYAVHLVTKMLDNASKDQLSEFISSLYGHVAPLLRHMVGSLVIEHAYNVGNASQKQTLLMELYSPELQLFKDLVSMKETRLVDVISKLQLQRSSVVRHMSSVLQPILEKGILDHSIIHRTLMEYLTIADQSSAADVIQQLSGPLLVRMIHTRDGSRVGILCIKHGSAKERKKIIKGMKGQCDKIARDRFGSMVLVSILSTVDDTKLLSKIIIRELEGILKELVLDQNGRRSLLQLLHPNCSRYLSPDDLMSLSLSIPSFNTKQKESSEVNEASDEEKRDNGEILVEANTGKSAGKNSDVNEVAKKDPLTRRRELLINSGLAEKLIDVCSEMAENLLRSKFGKEVIYEVVTGGADGVLHPALDEKLEKLYEVIATLVAEPKSEGAEDDHLLEDFHSSRTIRKLILDCPIFASKLWEKALKGKCAIWAQGHSCKVITAYLEASDLALREAAKKELQPLIDSGVLTLPAVNESAKADQDFH